MRYPPPYDIRRRDWLELSDSVMDWVIGIGAWIVILWLVFRSQT